MVYDVRQIATLRELIETSALDHCFAHGLCTQKTKTAYGS